MTPREVYEARRNIRRDNLINAVKSDCYYFDISSDIANVKTRIGQHAPNLFSAYSILTIPKDYSMTFSHIECRL